MDSVDLKKINWNNLKVFYEVAHAGNFSKAGHILGMSQPTITKNLLELEKEIGVKLIERTRGSRSTPLTTHGKVFLDLTSNFYKQLQESMEEVKETERISGKITIATTRGFAQSWLFPKLLEFKVKYPEIIIEITVADYFQALIGHDADIYISTKFLESQELTHEFLDEFELGVYTSKKYIERYGVPRTLEDLNHHKIISWKFHAALPHAHWILTAGLPQGIERQPSLVVDDTNLCIAAVENGNGISMFYEYIQHRNPTLIRILTEYNIGSIKMYLITNMKSKKIKRLQLFTQFIKQSSKSPH